MAFKVGLEIHVYLDVSAKLFCDCPVDFDAIPNTTICPVCTAQPGSKPMLPNKDAVDKAIQIALLLGCTLNKELLFQRKHYSWPDLPNGYQKTMSGDFGLPVGTNGKFKDIRIQQCHLEEDPARWDPSSGTVDYNRSGYPLMEIVTEPDFTDADTIREWIDELVLSLSYLQAMHVRAGIKGDVNVSIAPKYERAEIKNINSFTAITEAVVAEVQRQEEEIAAGKSIPLQTRTWDDDAKSTVFMRLKETASQYCFIPEPDLPLIIISQDDVTRLTQPMPQMPWEKRAALTALGLSAEDAATLANNFDLITLYEAVKDVDPALAARWVRREVVRIAHYNKKTVKELAIDPQQLRRLIALIKDKTITENVGQKIMELMGTSPIDVEKYVQEQGLASLGNADELKDICKQIISEQPTAVEDYRKGNEKSLHFLVGQVMRKTRGAAPPDVVLNAFKELLD